MSYLFCFACLTALVLTMTHTALAEEWKPPLVKLPKDLKRPYVACTADELARLRAAYAGNGSDREPVAAIVKKADDAMKKPIAYPPRGGQHNQWYQCDACQIALKTVDDAHHQCPKCNKVYSGEPYDDVIFAKKHGQNLDAASDAAWAFAITGQRQYADFAAQILKGYADRYTQYPYRDNAAPGSTPGKSGGHLNSQTLNEAMVITRDVAPAYDLLFDTLSPDDRTHIEHNLIRPMLANIAKHRAGKGNWQTWHNAAFITGGAAIGDESWVKRAIEDPDNGFLFQMKVSVSPEGMWYENSWGYHFYTLHAMVAITETSRRLGFDLWNHPSLKAMFTLPLRYTMPDGSLPRFGDDANSSLLKQGVLMTAAAHAYGDPQVAALLPTKPTFESVLLGVPQPTGERPSVRGSEVFPGAGHAILRTQGEARLAAAITFGPFGGFHGHFDKLSFVLFGHGQELGVDPGRAASQAYRLPIHKNWYRATISHNAVIVDGKSQEGAAGKLLAFASNPNYAAALTQCNSAYKGVDYRRLLLLTPDYLLVVDQLNADNERRFDWLYHHRGTSVSSAVADKPGDIAEPYVGNEFLQDTKAGTSDAPVTVDFAGDVGLRLTFNAETGSELHTATGVGKDVNDRVPLAMLTRHGRTIWFAAVLEPVAKGKSPVPTTVRLIPNHAANGAWVEVKRGDTVESITYSDDDLRVDSGQPLGQNVLLESTR